MVLISSLSSFAKISARLLKSEMQKGAITFYHYNGYNSGPTYMSLIQFSCRDLEKISILLYQLYTIISKFAFKGSFPTAYTFAMLHPIGNWSFKLSMGLHHPIDEEAKALEKKTADMMAQLLFSIGIDRINVANNIASSNQGKTDTKWIQKQASNSKVYTFDSRESLASPTPKTTRGRGRGQRTPSTRPSTTNLASSTITRKDYTLNKAASVSTKEAERQSAAHDEETKLELSLENVTNKVLGSRKESIDALLPEAPVKTEEKILLVQEEIKIQPRSRKLGVFKLSNSSDKRFSSDASITHTTLYQ